MHSKIERRPILEGIIAATLGCALYALALTLWRYGSYLRAVAIVIGLCAYLALEVSFAFLVLPIREPTNERRLFSFDEVLKGVPARARALGLARVTARLVYAVAVLLLLVWVTLELVPRFLQLDR